MLQTTRFNPGRLLAGNGQHADARGLAAGAVLAAIAAVGAAGSGLWHTSRAAPMVPRMAGSA